MFGLLIRLLPRFPIWEQHGGAAEPTCRNIDNGLAGEQNNFCGNLFTNRPADLDLYIGLLRAVLEQFPGLPLMGLHLISKVLIGNALLTRLMLLAGCYAFGPPYTTARSLVLQVPSCLGVPWLLLTFAAFQIGVSLWRPVCSFWQWFIALMTS